ncbi:MAG: hypothetical protein KKC18_08650 [Chloroflexi bacterium]|nr:hypothetical protein [Chloroflexota bacterium]
MKTIISTVDTYLIPTSEAFPEPPSTVIPTSTPVPTITSTVTGQWQSLPAVSPNCWERGDDGPSWQHWPSTAFSDINPGGLVADGDLLWIATHRGLIRLDVRTLECNVFTKAGSVSLAETYLLLPDGEGGLWVATDQGLLRFSGEQWQVAIPANYTRGIRAMGLRRAGDWCVEVERVYMRTGHSNISHFCFRESMLPLTSVELVEGDLDVTDCRQWQQAAWRSYHYVTPAGCKKITRQITCGYLLVAVSPNGDETWTIGIARLFHRRAGAVRWVEVPHRDVQAVAADPVQGGVWMATGDSLIHGEVRTAIEGGSPFTRYVFQPFSLNTEAFPGSAHALAVDEAGQVWAVNGDSVLRYNESDHAWRRVISVTHDVYAIAADPVRGVWIAGRYALSYFDGAQWQTWPTSNTHYGTPTALLADENGRVWMGTVYAGVWTTVPPTQSTETAGNEHPALDWRNFTAADGLASGLITALARGPDGRIYAAHHAGISIFDPTAGAESGRWTTLPGSDIDGHDLVNALAFAPSLRPRSGQAQAGGELWSGYYYSASLRRHQDGHWTGYYLPLNVGESDGAVKGVGALLLDDDGTLWVGTTGGLWRWLAAGEGEPRWETFDPDDLVVHNVLSLAQDDQRRIWVGGDEGVAVWEGDR